MLAPLIIIIHKKTISLLTQYARILGLITIVVVTVISYFTAQQIIIIKFIFFKLTASSAYDTSMITNYKKTHSIFATTLAVLFSIEFCCVMADDYSLFTTVSTILSSSSSSLNISNIGLYMLASTSSYLIIYYSL